MNADKRGWGEAEAPRKRKLAPRSRWLLPEGDAGQAEGLARELGISRLAARILMRRGYQEAEPAREFLHPRLESLHAPELMKGVREAAERLRRAVAEKEKILLYGDYDVDGTTSIVLLKTALGLAGAEAEYHVPHRLKEGYGMRPEVIEEAARTGVKLIISVDTGIRAIEVVRYAAELGIDVIVTDHHLPEQELPPALAVLNPNQPGCGYPEKNLCGAGVAFKLVQALLGASELPAERVQRLTESFLKMVAIATVADVVPLTGENRVIVKHGLAGLSSTGNPGLRALLEVAGFQAGDRLNAHQVAFRIAPRMNAAGRMASARQVIEMFLTRDAAEARRIAGELQELNTDRQQTEADMVRQILEICEQEPVTDAMKSLVFAGEGWHRGVVGIVASRVVERFHRPAFVLGIDAETGLAQGSGRSIPVFHLLEALETMPEMFAKFGGHRQAAGLTMEAGRIEEFRRRFQEYADSRLSVEDLIPYMEIDAEASLGELTDGVVEEVLGLGPFGYGNPAPVVAVRGVQLRDQPTLIKEKHLRFRVMQNGRSLQMKAWNFAERAEEFEPGRSLDIAFRLEHDDYSAARGYAPWQAVVKDVRAAE
ncbi:MAG: single-stranded-DNA-specific exonuclease RecJ [Acidimicrobiia bacterium]|nr:single-stranded-DNA-specific exonuclease RecJ [Acidimicrobiia bacterium]